MSKKNRSLIALDFDKTLINNHLHNRITERLIKKDFPKGMRSAQEVIDVLNNIDGLKKNVCQWLDSIFEKSSIELWDKESYRKEFKNYRKQDIGIHIITASDYPRAVSYFLKKYDLQKYIPKARVISVNHRDGKSPEEKKNAVEDLIKEYTDKTHGKPEFWVFVDDSKKIPPPFQGYPSQGYLLLLLTWMEKKDWMKVHFLKSGNLV